MPTFNDYRGTLLDLDDGWKPENFDQPLKIDGGDILVAADVHVPYHDRDLLADFFERADIQQVDAIVFLGDLLDMPTFSSWGRDDWTTHFKRELKMVRGIINLAARIAPKVYWSVGNHEERWMRKLDWQTDMELLAEQAGLTDLIEDKVLIVSDNPTILYEPGNWMLTHPGEYGSSPLVVPGKMADLEGKNVIGAHAHHWGQGISPSGKWQVAETGCIVKPELVRYLTRRKTTHRKWTQGYLGLSYGELSLYRGGE